MGLSDAASVNTILTGPRRPYGQYGRRCSVIPGVRFVEERGEWNKEFMMNARVDSDLCTGCGLCVDTCPDVFRMGEDDVAVVIGEPVPSGAKDTCQEAADDCPTEAISIEG